MVRPGKKTARKKPNEKKSCFGKLFWIFLPSSVIGLVLLAAHINVNLLMKHYLRKRSSILDGQIRDDEETTFMADAGIDTEAEIMKARQADERDKKMILHDLRLEYQDKQQKEEEMETEEEGRNKRRRHRIGEEKKMLKKKREKERRMRHPEEWDPRMKAELKARQAEMKQGRIGSSEVDFGNGPIYGQAPDSKKLQKQVKKEDFNGGWSLFRLLSGTQDDEQLNIYDVRFIMCRMAHGAYSRDPASMPFFRDLTMASQCSKGANRWELSWDEAEEYLREETVIPPSGFIHHEARVGSTLLANMLASDEHNLVYSEAQPMTSASFTLCQKCPIEDRVELLRMTAKLMGVSNFHSHLFFKLTPVSTTQLHLFQAAFPETPYIYLYREPVEVMISLLRKQKREKDNRIYTWQQTGRKKKGKQQTAPCLRPLTQVDQLLDLVSYERWVTTEEYCAAHLYVICKSAADAIDGDDHGLAVHYGEDLADRFIDVILPKHFKIALPPETRDRALQVSAIYSKQRVPREGNYKDDTSLKHDKAWPELKLYADKHVHSIYNQLIQLEESRRNALFLD